MADPSEIPILPSQVVAERTHLVIPSMPNWIEPTVEFLRQKAVMGGACQETRSGKLLIALHEAITNAIIHGNLELSSDLKEQGDSIFAETLAQRCTDPNLASRKVDIVVDFDGNICRWVITDQGRGFDVEKVLAKCLSDDPEVLLSSGRGILMMKSFLDDVRFELAGRRVILSLSRYSGEERRREYRVPFLVPLQVTPVTAEGTPNWDETYEAASRNFSKHGILFLQQQLQSSGKVLIGVASDKGIVHIPAEVKHSRLLGESGMELGCEFADPIGQGNPLDSPSPMASPQMEEVQQTVMSILENYQARQLPPHERRAHPRVVFNERVVILLDHRAEPVVGYARDLSKGGIALITQEPMPAEITVAFSPTKGQQAQKVRCRVTRCNLVKDGFYDVGATFLRLEHKAHQ
jgi:anti-sigma regulatory factor (Ser/Thr protein kinase)